MSGQVINLREATLDRYMEMQADVETMLARVEHLSDKGFKREAANLINKADKLKEKMRFYRRKLKDFKKFDTTHRMQLDNTGVVSFNKYTNFYGAANDPIFTTFQNPDPQ